MTQRTGLSIYVENLEKRINHLELTVKGLLIIQSVLQSKLGLSTEDIKSEMNKIVSEQTAKI